MDEDKMLDLLRRIYDFLKNDVLEWHEDFPRYTGLEPPGKYEKLLEEIEEVLNRE